VAEQLLASQEGFSSMELVSYNTFLHVAHISEREEENIKSLNWVSLAQGIAVCVFSLHLHKVFSTFFVTNVEIVHQYLIREVVHTQLKAKSEKMVSWSSC
jgi:hypothetical protein